MFSKDIWTRYVHAYIFLGSRYLLTHGLSWVFTYFPHQFKHVAPVRISHEKLVFTQSDMDISNFGVDEKGNPFRFDSPGVGLLPKSFVSRNMSSNSSVAVRQYLDWPSSP